MEVVEIHGIAVVVAGKVAVAVVVNDGCPVLVVAGESVAELRMVELEAVLLLV